MLNFLFIMIRRKSDSPMSHPKVMVSSPEKEDRYYTTRGSLGLDENGKVLMDHVNEDRGHVWPKLFITLSSKEKEDDFLAMKGCKLPQRPKKRAKLIQKSLLVSIFHTYEEFSIRIYVKKKNRSNTMLWLECVNDFIFNLYSLSS